MKNNRLTGILFFFAVIVGALFLRNTVKTSDSTVAKDMLFVGDLFSTIRFIMFVGIMLIIVGLAMRQKIKNHN